MHQLLLPSRFRCIQDGIYVGAYPTLRNFRFLKRLQLKTVISVIPEKPITDWKEFCEEHIHLIHFKVAKYKDIVDIDRDLMAQILSLLIDTRNLPVYLHCLDGGNVSSQIIMCFRKFQNWNWNVLYDEANRFVDEISSEDKDFVKNQFKQIEIKIAPVEYTPSWIKNFLYLEHHSSLDKEEHKKHPQGLILKYSVTTFSHLTTQQQQQQQQQLQQSTSKHTLAMHEHKLIQEKSVERLARLHREQEMPLKSASKDDISTLELPRKTKIVAKKSNDQHLIWKRLRYLNLELGHGFNTILQPQQIQLPLVLPKQVRRKIELL